VGDPENGNGNGNGRKAIVLGPNNLLTVATLVGIVGSFVGATWWLAVKTASYDRDIATLNAAVAQLSAEIKEAKVDCRERVIIEHQSRYYDMKNQWERFSDRNRDIVVPALEYRPLPGDVR
jgi:Tfp pilus assembly protein PilN